MDRLYRLTISTWSPDRSFPVLIHQFIGHSQDEAEQLFESHLAQDAALATAVAAEAVTTCWDCCWPCELVPEPPHGSPKTPPPQRPPHGGPPPGRPQPPQGGGGGQRPQAVPLPRIAPRPMAAPVRGGMFNPGTFKAPPIY